MDTKVLEPEQVKIQEKALFDFFEGIIPFYNNNWKSQSKQKLIDNTKLQVITNVAQPTQAPATVTANALQSQTLTEPPTQTLEKILTVNMGFSEKPKQETINTILNDISDDFNGEIQISNELKGLIEGLQGITKQQQQQQGGNCPSRLSLTKNSNQNYDNKNVILFCEGFGIKEVPIPCEAEIVHTCDKGPAKKHTFVYDGINYNSDGIISDFVNLRCDMKYLRWFEEGGPNKEPQPHTYRDDRIIAIVKKIEQYRTASNIYLIGISHGSLLMQRALIQLSQEADTKDLLNKIHLITISSPRYPKGGIINKIWSGNEQALTRVYNYYCVHDGMYNSKFVKFMMGKDRRLPPRIDALSSFKVSPIDKDILTSYKVIVIDWEFTGVEKGDPLYHGYLGLMFLGEFPQETPFGKEFIHVNNKQNKQKEHCASLTKMIHCFFSGQCASSQGGSNSSKKVSRYVKSDERVILGGRSRVIWLGKRGCRYIKRDGEYVKLSIASKSSK